MLVSAVSYIVLADFDVDEFEGRHEVILLQTSLDRSVSDLAHEELAHANNSHETRRDHASQGELDKIETNTTKSKMKHAGSGGGVAVSMVDTSLVTFRSSPQITWSFLTVLLSVGATLVWQFRHLPGKLFATSGAAEQNLNPVENTPQSMLASPCPVIVCGLLYILISSTLIKYNQWLMLGDRFPYAVNLTLNHQGFGSIMLMIMYKVKPSLFPSLMGPARTAHTSKDTLLYAIFPVALCFSGVLVLSNTAYTYGSVAFLQMMKEGNMVLVYTLSLVVGLEVFENTRARVLFCLLMSTALTINGEIDFSLTAFTVQGSSQLMEATKIVMQSVLLSSAGSHHMDPLTYNFLVQPMTACLLIVFLGCCYSFLTHIPVAPWAAYAEMWPYLLVNACVALALNFVIAIFMKLTSAIGYIVMGILKDVTLIIVDVLISGTQVSQIQIMAFAFQIIFASSYALLKHFSKPDVTKALDKEEHNINNDGICTNAEKATWSIDANAQKAA